MTIHKKDYLLSFWVQGVSIFVTDIHVEAYRALEVLYCIDHGTFKQYFTKKAYEKALNQGLVFYSNPHAFDAYQKELAAHIELFKEFFASEIRNRKILTEEVLGKFFEYTRTLCRDYTKMNFEFTDKAYANQEHNPALKENLAKVVTFKDQVRTFMNEVLFNPDGYANQLFSILGGQFAIAPAVLENLTQQELLDLFIGKRPVESVVIKRHEAFVEKYDLTGWLEGAQARAVIEVLREEVRATELVYGQAASRGSVIGRVKVIPVDYSNPKRVSVAMEAMAQGDILVAETTAPELMVACKKAGAIVTDMGGLLSHAAIISRELGIPCVVGTKVATEVLKDGDMIEVDANKGTVRLIH